MVFYARLTNAIRLNLIFSRESAYIYSCLFCYNDDHGKKLTQYLRGLEVDMRERRFALVRVLHKVGLLNSAVSRLPRITLTVLRAVLKNHDLFNAFRVYLKKVLCSTSIDI